jgi:hypothetical protein
MTMLMEPRAEAQGTATAAEKSCDDASALVRRECNQPAAQVALVLDPSRLRRVHGELAARLTLAGIRVGFVRGRAEQSPPAAVELLLELERLVHRLPASRLSDRIALDQLMLDERPAGQSSDLVFDLCGDEAALPKGTRAGRTIRLTYDGVAGESVLIGALVAGRMPTIELKDAHTGAVLARGVPCADNAATVSEALDCVLARIVTLVVATARGATTLAPERRAQPAAARLKEILTLELKTLARAVVHRLYRLCFHTPHWRTCWRHVDGPDLWSTRSLAGMSWQVIPDPGFRFYADPFPLVHEGQTYVFVEDFDHRAGKAVISVVPFDERGPTGPARPVLEEPWHLSYPFVFERAGQIWMIPESSADKSISLYRADRFPDRWVREATLVAGIEASDATIIAHAGSLWMFAATRDGAGSWSDTLSIFSAPDLHGPWTAHPLNPVLVDQAAARPAGAMFVSNGRLWRPVQDCTDGYGTGIGLAEVVRLDRDGFEQRVHHVLRADPRWPGRRFHTLNRAGRLELIDGAAYSPRSRRLAQRLEDWSGRREPPAHWSPQT